MKILVLGGRGFIGRNVVNALMAKNIETVIGSRKAYPGQLETKQIQLHKLLNKDQWLPLIEGFDAVINCVGILRERWGETYEAIHSQAPAALALACKVKGIRIIHISALGLSNQARSRFIRSKYAGEQNLIQSGASVVIVRPSLLDGDRGFGAQWIRRVSNWPIHPVARTNGLIAPLQVKDLGEAIANIAISEMKLPAQIELGGTNIYTFSAYLAALKAETTTSKATIIRTPVWIVRMVSHILDLLHMTPLSFGHVELMQGYNVPSYNYLPILLRRSPAPVGLLLNKPIEIDSGAKLEGFGIS